MLQPWEDGCLPVTLSVLVCVSPRALTGTGEENGGGGGGGLLSTFNPCWKCSNIESTMKINHRIYAPMKSIWVDSKLGQF